MLYRFLFENAKRIPRQIKKEQTKGDESQNMAETHLIDEDGEELKQDDTGKNVEQNPQISTTNLDGKIDNQ